MRAGCSPKNDQPAAWRRSGWRFGKTNVNAHAASPPKNTPIIVHADVRRLAAFAELPGLRSANAVMDAWDGMPQTARAWSPAEGPAYEIFASREQLRTLYEAGCTIVLEDVEHAVAGGIEAREERGPCRPRVRREA